MEKIDTPRGIEYLVSYVTSLPKKELKNLDLLIIFWIVSLSLNDIDLVIIMLVCLQN